VTPFQILGPVVVADGGLVATWKRRLVRAQVDCSTSPLTPLSPKAVEDVQLALTRYARFLDRSGGAGRQPGDR